MALVPFPADSATVALATATTALRAALKLQSADPPDTVLRRTARTVSARIERYAQDAPQDVKDEALIRAVGWLLQSGKTGEVVAEGVGDKSQSYDPRVAQGWFRHSSAMSLLSPWRVRNAGLVQA